ncbi:MAG: FAD-binding oxidoreductase, partial [Phycisphaerae bacterium]
MSNSGQLEALLRGRIKGHVRFDPLYRSLYATDASMYEQVPIGVAMPRDVADVVQIVRCCREVGVSITARGAGTGLTGGAVGEGLQVDFSRYMNRILEVDPQRRIARVQPGVVLDVLNARLGGCGLQFAPDVATSSRATIGGMIANNSCGAHSGVYGTTADHVESLTLVLSDGSVVTWSAMDPASWQQRCRGDSVEAVGLRTIQQVLRDHAGLIRQRYPKLLRCNGGYGLDRLLQDDPPDPTKLVCGSEGTLGLVVEAMLRLTPLPACRAVLVAHFHDLMESLSAVPRCLEHSPAAVELIDQMILDASADNPALARRRGFLRGRPKAILAIEFFGQDRQDLLGRLQQLQRSLEAAGLGYAFTSLTDSQAQLDLWEVRKAGLGLLMSRPGDRQPYAFIEDTAA